MLALPVWINVAVVIGSALAGVWDGRRLRRRNPGITVERVLGRAPYLYALAVTLAVMVGAHLVLDMRPDLSWHLPEWLQLYYTAIAWGTILAAFSFLFSLGLWFAFIDRHAERFKLAVASVLLLVAVHVAQWQFTRPIAGQLFEKISADGIILQSSDASCAAASGANIAHELGVETTERAMAERFGTTAMGTSAAQVIHGFAAIDITCVRREIDACGLNELAAPAMLFVDHPVIGPESHALFMRARAGEREVWDPLGGRISLESLCSRWRGRALACRRRAR